MPPGWAAPRTPIPPPAAAAAAAAPPRGRSHQHRHPQRSSAGAGAGSSPAAAAGPSAGGWNIPTGRVWDRVPREGAVALGREPGGRFQHFVVTPKSCPASPAAAGDGVGAGRWVTQGPGARRFDPKQWCFPLSVCCQSAKHQRVGVVGVWWRYPVGRITFIGVTRNTSALSPLVLWSECRLYSRAWVLKMVKAL